MPSLHTTFGRKVTRDCRTVQILFNHHENVTIAIKNTEQLANSC